MERRAVAEVSERDNRGSQKDSVGTLREIFFSKKNCISLALLLVKGSLLVLKWLRGKNE